MARQKIIAVRDREVDAFNRPIFVNSIGQATRMFRDEINRVSIQGNDNIMYQHPDDFDLYELGEWDEETGKFFMLEVPRQIAIGKDMKERS